MPLLTISDLGNDDSYVQNLVDRATQISQLYDDFIERDEGDGHLRAPGIHASEISQCERKIVYNITNAPKKGAISKNWRQRFQFGKAIHQMIQDDFYAMARKSNGLIYFEAELPIGPKYQDIARKLNIHSACDGVFLFRDEAWGPATLRVGLEIKTEAQDGFAKLTAPKSEHIDQAHVYMRCLDLPLMYFMYVNKNNQNNTASIEPFLIKFDPMRWAKIEEKCRRLLAMAANNELPDRQESIVCSFCPWAHLCQPTFGAKRTGSSGWKQIRK